MSIHNLQSESVNSDSFIKLPKKLFNDEKYKGLSLEAKILYAMLCDRRSLSEANGWYDENRQVYIYYSVEAVMHELNCCKSSACKIFKELEKMHLIRKVKQGLGRLCRIYILKNSDLSIESEAAANTYQKSEKAWAENIDKESSYRYSEDKTKDITEKEDHIAYEVMNYLNQKTNKNYMPNSKNISLISERLKEGYSFEDFIHVIDVKYEEWYGTNKEKYIRPSTLFKARNFDNYVNQRSIPAKNTKKTYGKTRLENEHDYDAALLERALFGD